MNARIYNDDLGQDIEIADIPEDLMDLANEYREKLLENVAEHDEELMIKYLEGGEEINPDDINRAIRAATIKVEITPVLCGSSYKNKGVQPLMDAIVEYLPSPLIYLQ